MSMALPDQPGPRVAASPVSSHSIGGYACQTPCRTVESPLNPEDAVHLVKLLDSSSHLMHGAVTEQGVVLHRVDPAKTAAAAHGFLDSRTTRVGLVALAYRDLEAQTDRQYARLTDESGPYRFKVVSTRTP